MNHFFVFLSLSLLFISCNKKHVALSEVEVFIEKLKENKADSFEVPDFSVENITALLE